MILLVIPPTGRGAALPDILQKRVETQAHSSISTAACAAVDRGGCDRRKRGNLKNLPATGFTIGCFAVKLGRGATGLARAARQSVKEQDDETGNSQS